MTTFSPNLDKGLEGLYRVRMGWRFSKVEFLGLPHLKDERPVTLPDLYIPLRFQDKPGRNEASVTVRELFGKIRHVVVLGDPGSGKSTLVNFLTYSFARYESTPLAREVGAYLPIPIILRDYNVRKWKRPADMLGDFVQSLKRHKDTEDIADKITVEWLLDALEQGHAVLILDGLDEVGSKADREHLRDEIVYPLLKDASKSRAVLTSRIVGYEEAEFDSLRAFINEEARIKRFYVAPFNDEDITQFVTRWYNARERDSRVRSEKLDSFRNALKRNERIRQLASNPFLLTMMTLIHRVTSDLPSGRVKLYDKIVEAYLETIQRFRGLETYDASLEQMERWLSRIGWEMQSRRSGNKESELLASKEEVLGWLRDEIEKDHLNAQEKACGFLDYVARRSGLLIERGPDQFAFVHLTFQEYFAARQLFGGLRRFDTLAEECAEKVADRQWHETLVLLFEMLTMFPGSGNDLADLLIQKAEDKPALAEFFAELALDEQNGLGLKKLQTAVEFALVQACETYNKAITDRLKQLPADRIDAFVHSWFDRQLQDASPQTTGKDFFITALKFPIFEAKLPEMLSEWITTRNAFECDEQHVEDVLHIAGSDPSVCDWAVDRLSYARWIYDFWYFSNADLNLADFHLPKLLSIQKQSPRRRLLAQFGALFTACRLHILSNNCLVLTAPDEYEARATARIRTMQRVIPMEEQRVMSMLTARPRAMAVARAAAMARARLRAMPRAMAMARAMARAMDEQFPNQFHQSDPATTVAKTEWYFSHPDCPPDEFQTQLGDLSKLASAPEDWPRLAGLTSLMLLGEGTPEMCAERNTLLDKGMKDPCSFTFPEDVREAADKDDFRKELPDLLQHVFLHEVGDPWLKPEWFDRSHADDPKHPAWFFCANPRQFYARAAEVLDPNNETELSKWKTKAVDGGKKSSSDAK